jgi:hypothetical protein
VPMYIVQWMARGGPLVMWRASRASIITTMMSDVNGMATFSPPARAPLRDDHVDGRGGVPTARGRRSYQGRVQGDHVIKGWFVVLSGF